jgi:hypothetical protein
MFSHKLILGDSADQVIRNLGEKIVKYIREP